MPEWVNFRLAYNGATHNLTFSFRQGLLDAVLKVVDSIVEEESYELLWNGEIRFKFKFAI